MKEDLHRILRRENYCFGTACPPYHLAIVIGGTSAEANLKTVKSIARYLDDLPSSGDGLEVRFGCHLKKNSQTNAKTGIGAQFVENIFVLMFE